MPERDTQGIDVIDLSKITEKNAIRFFGKLLDGRGVELGVDLFNVGADFAYGITYATTETEAGSNLRWFDHNLSSAFARLPHSGVIQGDSYDLDVYIPPQGITSEVPHVDSPPQTEWSVLPVKFEAVRLEVTRSRAIPPRAAAMLLKLV